MGIDFHDPIQCLRQLRQTLAADKLSVGFFLGAGCPCAVITQDDKGNAVPLIPAIKGLTDKVCESLGKSPEHKARLDKLTAILTEGGKDAPNVELMLNRIRALRDVAGAAGIQGFTSHDLEALDREICQHIKTIVSPDLPGDDTPYHALAEFIRNRRYPVSEIFTTNYDLLLEQALEACQAPFFDGFIGSFRPFFDQLAIEEDKIPVRWARLWKLHGSINWRSHKKSKVVFRSIADPDGDELLIHPSHRKYDESRRMPYLVMIDRLRAFLRNRDKPVALVIVGYSFGDEHLNEVIVESLKSNPSAAAFALQFDNLTAYSAAKALAEKNVNLSLYARDAAIIRKQNYPWKVEQSVDVAALGHAFEIRAGADGKVPAAEDSDDPRPCNFHLGNFAIFGKFLKEFSDHQATSDSVRT